MEYKNLKILIIDDVQDNLITLSALIRESFTSAKVLSALNGSDGINIAKKENPDMILLDILMPGMDGYKVCKILKNDPETEDIPVVFVTALRNDSENKIKALEVGADGFISKPIDEAELVAQIRAMIKIKKASQDKKSENIRLKQLIDEKTLELRIQNESTQYLLENLQIEFEKRELTETKYRTLFNNMFDGFALHEIICDENGNPIDYRFIDVNQAFENLTNLKAKDIIGKTVLEVLPNTENKPCSRCRSAGNYSFSAKSPMFYH